MLLFYFTIGGLFAHYEVRNVWSSVTESSVSIYWAAPKGYLDDVKRTESYCVQYECAIRNATVRGRVLTGKAKRCTISKLPAFTLVSFTIHALYEGVLGPGVHFAQSTGIKDIRVCACLFACVLIVDCNIYIFVNLL